MVRLDLRDGMKRLAFAALLLGLAPVWPAAGETLFSSSSNRSAFDNALKVLDGRAAEQYSGSVRYTPGYVDGADGAIPAYSGKYRGAYLETARAAARRYSVPEDLFLRLVQAESAWNPAAKSAKGALGLAQLMPDTATKLGIDPLDPTENLNGGARYLRMQYDRFHSWRLAIAAYNAGPDAVEQYDGVPPYAETEGYVKAILGS
jgi:soluble lytic murein transglycosylase-like protein